MYETLKYIILVLFHYSIVLITYCPLSYPSSILSMKALSVNGGRMCVCVGACVCGHVCEVQHISFVSVVSIFSVVFHWGQGYFVILYVNMRMIIVFLLMKDFYFFLSSSCTWKGNFCMKTQCEPKVKLQTFCPYFF